MNLNEIIETGIEFSNIVSDNESNNTIDCDKILCLDITFENIGTADATINGIYSLKQGTSILMSCNGMGDVIKGKYVINFNGSTGGNIQVIQRIVK